MIYTVQNHSHIASMGFNTCTVNDILCPRTLVSSEKKKKMEETLEEQQNHSLQVDRISLKDAQILMIISCKF